MVFPDGSVVKNSLANAERRGFNFWIGKILWRMKWQPTPVFLFGKYHDRGVWWTIVHGVSREWNRT